jgi:hypothetical protein
MTEHEHEHEHEEDLEGEDLLIVSGVKTIDRYRRDGREILVLDFGHGPRRFAALDIDDEARPWAGRKP